MAASSEVQINSSLIPGLKPILLRNKFIKDCMLCKDSYKQDKKPFQVSCGHSICCVCKETYKEKHFYCSKCVTCVPSSIGAIENKSLWEQISRLEMDKELREKVEEKERFAGGDPLIKVEMLLFSKIEQVVSLRVFYEDVEEKFQKYKKYEEIGETYNKLMKDFSKNQTNLGDGGALIILGNNLKEIESTLKTITDFDKLENDLNSAKGSLFTNEKMEITFSYETVCDLLDKCSVFGLLERNNEVVAVRCSKEEIGFHIHRCVPDKKGNAFFWCQNIRDVMNISVASHLFLDMSGFIVDDTEDDRPFNMSRRIYISIREDVYKNELFDYFIGVKERLFEKELSMRFKHGHHIANLPNNFKLIKSGDYPVADDENGLVCLKVNRDKSTEFSITVDAAPDVKRQMAIGKVISGINFLYAALDVKITGCGFCIQDYPSTSV